MYFEDILPRLRLGDAAARTGWNGKGLFVYYVAAGNYAAMSPIAKKVWGADLVPYTPYLAIKAVDGRVSPWLASQTDLLAGDWTIVSPGELSKEGLTNG